MCIHVGKCSRVGASWRSTITTGLIASMIIATTTPVLASPPNKAQLGESKVTTQTQHKHTNSLINATSPYLLQHAHNPVNWHEWGEEALKKAKKEDKLIFLSIGYAACHWCHVMEHESFEQEDVAAILNEHFISIKVDREERPDIDEIYMAYTQASTGHGGWPMSVWLLPDGQPFLAGTYFPKARFMATLNQVSDSWISDRQKIFNSADDAQQFFADWSVSTTPATNVTPRKMVDSAANNYARYFDKNTGGMSGGGTNKFPPSMAMDLMLRVYKRNGNGDLFDAVKLTLDHMARGGIYDHLGGGICRYSTDVNWLVPHFEKMLYDQGMVSAIYLDAYQVSKDPLYAYIAADIFDYVITDMQDPKGGFYSSRDADSEGLEGKFYIWTVEQINQILGPDEGKLFCAYYDVTPEGNWIEYRGHAPAGAKNILHITTPPDLFAKKHKLDVGQFKQKLKTWRSKLMQVRSMRVPPPLDDKVLTGWNGLMIASMAKGARVLGEPKYAAAAAKAAQFILDHMRKDGRLLRTYRMGQARLTAYLSDYAFFIDGLINLYEATGQRKWLDAAIELTETSIKYYFDEGSGGFFFTAHDAETLIARSKNSRDGAIPAGNSVHAMNLLRLAVLLDRKDFRERAESIFRDQGGADGRSTISSERLLCAVDFYHDRVKEIVIIGDPGDEATKALLRTVYSTYLPNKVVVAVAKPDPDSDLPLLKGKQMRGGKPTAYVCEKYTCKLPVTTPHDLAGQLTAKK